MHQSLLIWDLHANDELEEGDIQLHVLKEILA